MALSEAQKTVLKCKINRRIINQKPKLKRFWIFNLARMALIFVLGTLAVQILEFFIINFIEQAEVILWRGEELNWFRLLVAFSPELILLALVLLSLVAYIYGQTDWPLAYSRSRLFILIFGVTTLTSLSAIGILNNLQQEKYASDNLKTWQNFWTQDNPYQQSHLHDVYNELAAKGEFWGRVERIEQSQEGTLLLIKNFHGFSKTVFFPSSEFPNLNIKQGEKIWIKYEVQDPLLTPATFPILQQNNKTNSKCCLVEQMEIIPSILRPMTI